MFFPLLTYNKINDVIDEKAVWQPGKKIVPDTVPEVSDIIKEKIVKKFGDDGERMFVIWCTLNSMFQGLHKESWPVASACAYGLFGQPVSASFIESPPTESWAVFVTYSNALDDDSNNTVGLSLDVEKFIKASILSNGDVMLPKILQFASDGDARIQFEKYADVKDIVAAGNKVSAMEELVKMFVDYDIKQFYKTQKEYK